MTDLRKFYINGEWVEPVSSREMDVINPATEAKFATITLGTSDDVDRAVAAAKAAFPTYSRTVKKSAWPC